MSIICWSEVARRNHDKDMARKAEWAAKNRARATAINAAYRDKNPTKSAAYSAEWRAKNPDRARIQLQNKRAKKRENGGRLSSGLAEKLFVLQKASARAAVFRLVTTSTSTILFLLRSGPNSDTNIQLLRRKCNMSKGAKHPLTFMQAKGFLL